MLADVSVSGWRPLKLKKDFTVKTSLGSSFVASRSSSVRCRQTGTLGTAPPGGRREQKREVIAVLAALMFMSGAWLFVTCVLSFRDGAE